MYPCYFCQKQTVHIQRRINHILHLLLTVLFVGLWLIVWVGIAVFGTRTPVCTVCGMSNTVNVTTPEPKKEITSEDRKNFYNFVLLCFIGMGGVIIFSTICLLSYMYCPLGPPSREEGRVSTLVREGRSLA